MIKDIRFRSEKYTKKIITKDLYKKWISENPEYSKYSFKDFKDFWKLLSEKYLDFICTNSNGINLNSNLGELSLKYVTTSDINKNYNSSKIAEEPVGHLNFSSGGKNGKIVWSVAFSSKINSELPLVAFKACRKFTKLANTAFSETPELFKITKATKNNVKAIHFKHKYNNNEL